jgi:hypothetical protein
VSVRQYRELEGWRAITDVRDVGQDLRAVRVAADVRGGLEFDSPDTGNRVLK